LWKIFGFKKPVENSGVVFHRFSTGSNGLKSNWDKAFKKFSTVSTGPTTTIFKFKIIDRYRLTSKSEI
jgi:hypothetical protein